MTSLDRKLVRDLWHIRGQALAIALMMAAGVAMSVMSLGMLRSLEETLGAYYERYRFADVFAQVKRAPDWLATRVAAIPGVGVVETRIVADVTLNVPGLLEPATGRLISLPERGAPHIDDIAIRQGRRLAPGRASEVVASEAFAEANRLVPGDTFSAVINGVERRLTIVGIALSPEYVYSIGPGALVPDDRRFGVLWMGSRTLAAAFDMDGAFNDLALALLPGASQDEVVARLDQLLDPYGGTGAYAREHQQSNWFLSNELKELTTLATIAPPIFLGVAAFLLNVVASRLVETQREQVGLLKAFGYGNLAVAWHYAKLVGVIVIVGAALGVGAGIWLGRGLAELYTQFFRFPFLHYQLGGQALAVPVLASIAAAALGAFAALRRVFRLAPAVAMQPPAPMRYGRTGAFGLRLVNALSPPSRMIARHIVRRPLRSALTVVSLSSAVAVLIAAMFMLDAIDYMLEVHFHQSQRQDLTVSFTEPEPGRVVHDAARLPGVLRAEPFRAVPVRLRFGHLSERTSIQGVDPAATLGRQLDHALAPLSAPPAGLMLSSWLAGELGVGLGDRITVEVMEGRRPVRALPVTALVEELIGARAYMRMDALNRLMGEGPSVSSVNLQIDPERSADLYRRLKETPAVADTVILTAALQSVRDTLGETLLKMTSFQIAFAAIIAFGVVYNSARISLSERGRELASLRVIGFRHGEVSFILLGELAVLTLLALPLGCVIGRGLAWALAVGLQSDLYRVPLVVERSTYGLSVALVVAAWVACALVVALRVRRLDLIAVLKTRE
ncbi:MAG TPA: FtsX-like permease family protein [Alphaproteobacteria bacterium]